jgi:hypothetical protein
MVMQNRKSWRNVRGLIWIFIMAALVVALLAIANWVPSLMNGDSVQRFETVEEAEIFLGYDDPVLVPKYFPEGISWPPSLIVAQKKPYRAVVTEYHVEGTTKTGLIIILSSIPGGDLRLQRITITEPQEKTRYSLKGKKVVLEVGTCGNEEACSRVSWLDEDIKMSVLLMSSPFEVLRIAESMIHD